MPDNAPLTGGSAPGADRYYVDGDQTVARPCGPPVITFPFEGDSFNSAANVITLQPATNPTGYKYVALPPAADQEHVCGESFVIEQDFQIAADFFEPLALNSFYSMSESAPDYQGTLLLFDAVLVHESSPKDVDGGMVRWTRTYAVVPPTRNTYDAFQFTFPGYAPTIVGSPKVDLPFLHLPAMAVELNDGAIPRTVDVVARCEHRFFLVPNGNDSGSITPDQNDQDSMFYVVPQFKVFYRNRYNEMPNAYDFDWVNNVVIGFQDLSGADSDAPAKNTIPPKTSDNPVNDDDSGVGFLDMIQPGNEVCVKASQFRQWRGNIWEKITLFAQPI